MGHHNITTIESSENKPELEVTQLWELERVGILPESFSPSERETISLVRSNMHQSESGCIIRLPFKDDTRPSVNYRTARGQLNHLVQRAENDEQFGQHYSKVVRSYVEKEFIEQIPNHPLEGHYMPHHAVFKKSTTTPLRIVFNASSKPNEGKSLNDCLLTSPSLTAKLHEILVQFRQRTHAVTADISKACHRIIVDPEHRKFLKFLWLNLESYELHTYQFKVVLFGATCSPYLLQETLQTHLSQSAEGSKFVDKFYVDNYMNTYDNQDELVTDKVTLDNVMNQASMPLQEWVSNNKHFNSLYQLSVPVTQNVLGISWNPNTDNMNIVVGEKLVQEDSWRYTKRKVLSLVSSIYDPLGWVSPLTVRGKMFIQTLWKEKMGWDQKLNPDQIKVIHDILVDLRRVTEFVFPRHILYEHTELHVFTDASSRAYGAAVYTVNDTRTQSNLLMSKARVAPCKEGRLTIPKLELTASLIGTTLINYLTNCDAPRTSEELPVPMASSPTSPTPPAVQVKQYSWRHNAITNKCFYDKRREFVNSSKHTNHASLLLPQQAPLVSQAHLLSVVRKVEKSERVKGKLQQKFVVKNSSPNRGKTMTSLSLSRQKSEGKEQQCSIHTDRSKSETNQFIPIYQYKTNIYTLKPSESGKEQRGSKFKRPGATNCQNSDDVISDGINRGGDVNRLIARNRYATTKHSFSHTKEFLKAILNICKQSFIQLDIILAVVISLIGSGLNMNLLKLVCIAGLAVVVCQEYGNNSNGTFPLAISVLVYAILAVLRESTAAITSISKVLGSCIQKVMVFDNKKEITRYVGVLQNTIIRGMTYYCTTLETTTFPVNVLAGKHINAYIFPSADVYASWIDYFDTYTRNFESEYKIMIFCKLVYLYIFAFYLSWVSCDWATPSSVILYTLVYLSLKWINSVIRIHDKYQSYFLVGLALTCKASFQIRYILFHYRLYWRELRPLVTPWADRIKEGIEPSIVQKRFMPSHAQVRLPLLSLLSLLLLLL